MTHECVLNTLPGSSDTERVVVVLVPLPEGGNKISLRQQNWAEGIGWYDQKCLDLEQEQFRQLRRGGASVHTARRSSDESEVATLPFPGLARVESA